VKFKTDENIGRSGIELLRASGHDVSTVVEEDLQGESDSALHLAALEEGRILVTLDRGFGQVLRFLDRETPGIVILECGKPLTQAKILGRLQEFLAFVSINTPENAIWIIEAGRIRIHLKDRSPGEE
jgi:predicted nuclease of predicted toxin-antitoxin system